MQEDLKELVEEFRGAMERAKNAGEFGRDFAFSRFPKGCCSDACMLLATYLRKHKIDTVRVNGWFKKGSHAWLETKDGTIIDITADQFKDSKDHLNFDQRVYVGKLDRFHKLFKYPREEEYQRFEDMGLSDEFKARLIDLYNSIESYCKR